jgi:hypothetical protein
VKRSVLRFSVRSDAAVPLDEMRACLERAMGCSFGEGDFHKVPALVTELLGMRISLFEWRGLAGARTFRLQGRIDDARFLEGPNGTVAELEGTDISQAIVDLLALRCPGTWRIPSRAEIEAELDHGDAVERGRRG